MDSPVRAFKAVGGEPLFIARGEGPWLFDVDGNRYIDYVLSWGPLVLGHAHPRVVAAVAEAAARGTSFGAPSPLELELARLVRGLVPSVEMIRFVNSGTEAVMSALRLARAFTRTGQDRQVRRAAITATPTCFSSRPARARPRSGCPIPRACPPRSPRTRSPAPTTTSPAVEELFESYRGQIAAIIVEPVAGNMGVVPPEPGFLQGLRSLCTTARARS